MVCRPHLKVDFGGDIYIYIITSSTIYWHWQRFFLVRKSSNTELVLKISVKIECPTPTREFNYSVFKVELFSIYMINFILDIIVNDLDLSFTIYSNYLVPNVWTFLFWISRKKLNPFFHMRQSLENAMLDRSFVSKVFLVVKKNLVTVFQFHCNIAISN